MENFDLRFVMSVFKNKKFNTVKHARKEITNKPFDSGRLSLGLWPRGNSRPLSNGLLVVISTTVT
jgi:hypothetical protein